MCTMIVERAKISGSGKGPNGWFRLSQINVSYDHPFHAPLDHALNIDFVNQSEDPSARIAVELSRESAVQLIQTITTALERAIEIE